MKNHERTNSKTRMPVIAALVIGLAGGVLISNYTLLGEDLSVSSDTSEAEEKEILYWVAPMDPEYRRDKPGKSPMGMDLVPVYAEEKKEPGILYWVAPMDPGYRRDGPGKSPMGMDLVPVYADDTAGSEGININAAVEQALGVRTSEAVRRSLWRKVEATGYVGFDESLVSQINVRTEGWIERLLVSNEGQRVRKGEPLFEFYSPQLVNAQKEYVQARRRNDARIEAAAKEKLLALGMEQADIRQLAKTSQVTNAVQVLAPQNGTVTSLNVKEGMFIKPATEIMSLADLSSVWLQAGVFESQAEWVTESQPAEARLNYIPGEVFSGRVDYVYPVLDPKTRTLQVRLRFDNPEERLKPNMYARVTIFGKSHPGALSIPREALIRGQDFDRVVVSLGDGSYTVHEVISGIESGNWVEIIAGLEEGDEVVTSAQFLIDSEASLAGSFQRLDAARMAHNEGKRESVFGNGTVEAIDAAARRVRISHGPIEALGWAPMTMEFDVLPGADLATLKIGQGINFTLSQSEVGDYVIDIIDQSPPAGVEEPSPDEESSPDHEHMHHQPETNS
ncbi:MAG: efflux RND transporter periplasmic adaptor subunit [Gammaproteobacteria bacterium]|nr:efflux RND transporter periplasmic adaptor subunit [Gammaproteobacteria bacterium]